MSRRPRYTATEIQEQLAAVTSETLIGGAADGWELQLAPVIRHVVSSRQSEAYLKELSELVRRKDDEIETVCNANYQDFIASTDKLLSVRQGTVSLKHRVVDLNADIQSKGNALANKKRELLDARRTVQNIDETIESLQACLQVLDLSSKVSTLIDQQKYYAALRSLDDLQNIHLKPLLHFSFASYMLSTLPAMRQQIREAATREMKSWLYEAREASRPVGKAALGALDERNRRWAIRKAKDVDGTLRLARINGPVELAVSERHELDVLNNAEVKVDFRPLYQCIHVYETLDILDELQMSYQEDRKAQAALLLSATATLSPASFAVAAFEELLEQLTGFFIIEAHVRRTTGEFRPEHIVDDLWDDSCERMVALVQQALKVADEPDVLLGAKSKLLAFVQTIEGYGYSTAQPTELLASLFEQFTSFLSDKAAAGFQDIVIEDDSQAMVVNDAEEFEKVIAVSWLPAEGEWSESAMRGPGFPLALPFSQIYPLCCIDIRNFIDQYYQFAEGFYQHHYDVDDALRKALDKLLTVRVSGALDSRIKATTNLSQLAQIVVNLLFFETACLELTSLLATMRASHRGGAVELESIGAFGKTMELCHTRIVRNIALKLDACFELAGYDWQANGPPPTPKLNGEAHPSTYLTEMVDYLTTVVDSVLVQLPSGVRDGIYRGALEHIADTMMGYLTNDEPKIINDNGLGYFALDVRFMAAYATSLNADVFEELVQLVALLQSDSVSDFLDPTCRDLGYARVQSTNLAAVLIKLIMHSNMQPAAYVDHKRKKDMEEVLKSISRR